MTGRAFAPGRVNLIGEHTDYNDGWALAFATAQGVTVTATAIPERTVRVRSTASGQIDEFDPVQVEHIHGWRAFARGTVMELAADGVDVRGTEITIDSDLPQGIGLSSSAALTVALTLAVTAASGHQPLPPLAVAKLAQRVENDWVGTRTGLLDQLASLHGRDGHACLIDFADLSVQQLPLQLGEHRLVVINTGERARDAGYQYNLRRQQAHESAYRMRLETLREATITDLHMLPDELTPRARHVISENGRVLNAAGALRRGDLELLGMLLTQSHDSLRDDYEVSTPALDTAVQQLLDAGALGARMIGAGFGGSVLALMAPGAAIPPLAQVVAPAAGARLLS